MIRTLNKNQNNPEIRIADAAFPAVFPHALEFNPPAHGTWNIVHIGMLIPEAHQIYICAVNCMRGVVLTAAEMKEQERFSFVILKEEDLAEGTVEDITLEGVRDVIRKLPAHPPALILFPVCTHHFLGCDMKRIYRELENEFPDIDFIRAWMDPIMQKEGPTPDQKLRCAMYRKLPALKAEKNTYAILGGNVSVAHTSDLYLLAELCGVDIRQMPECGTYEEYRKLGSAEGYLGLVPNSKLPVQQTARRLERKAAYLPMNFSYSETLEQWKSLGKLWNSSAETDAYKTEDKKIIGNNTAGSEVMSRMLSLYEARKEICERAWQEAKDLLGDVPIRIDYTAHPRPLGLTRFLLEHGFHVDKIYLNAVSGEEQEDFVWLKTAAPELLLCGTIQPLCRRLPRGSSQKVLAIGQTAAWFSDTPYFVNMVEGGDLWGLDGMTRMAALVKEAWMNEKDTRDLIPRKGLGCESCI